MIKEKKAYKCYCTKETLNNLRKNQILVNQKPKYNNYCRTINKDLSLPYVIRFRNPESGYVTFYDEIRGTIKIHNNEIDDFILRRSNGSFTYNFCAAIDDWNMKITHVIRGDDHINNTPKQINILKSMHSVIPKYAHLPMILDENQKKFSKRNLKLSTQYFIDKGYLPEGIINYVLRLGWGHKNQEIFSVQEMIHFFSLEKVSKSPSIFSISKLNWINQYYMNKMPLKYIKETFKKYLQKQNINYKKNNISISEIINLFRSRCSTLEKMAKSCHFFYKNINIIYFKKFQNQIPNQSCKVLILIYKKIFQLQIWKKEEIYKIFNVVKSKLKIPNHTLYMPIRIAITGSCQSPKLSDILYIIGKNKILIRIKKFLIYIKRNLK